MCLKKIIKLSYKKYSTFIFWPQKLIIALILIFSTIYISYLKLVAHFSLQTSSFDLGIHANVAWNTIHGNFLYSSILGINYLGEHFSPIHFLTCFSLLIWENAGVLLVLQSIGIALGGLAVYLLALKIIKEKIYSFFLMLCYLAYPYLHEMSKFDFHPIALAVPAFLWCLYFWETEKRKAFFLSLFILLLIKENVPLIISGLSVFLIVRKKKKLGLIILVLSLLIFVFEIKFLIPFFRGHGATYPYFYRYANLGGSFSQIIINIFTHPYLLLEESFLNPEKLHSVIKLFILLGFIPFFAGKQFIPVVIPLILNLISSYKPQWEFSCQYSATLIPFIFYATIYGFKNLQEIITNFSGSNILAIKGTMLSFLFLLIIVMKSNMPPYFGSYNKKHVKAAFEVFDSIPSDVSICAQSNLVPHLSMRKNIYHFRDVPGYDIRNAQYIILDLKGVTWPFTKESYIRAVMDLLINSQYGIVKEMDNVILLKKNALKNRNKKVMNVLNPKGSVPSNV